MSSPVLMSMDDHERKTRLTVHYDDGGEVILTLANTNNPQRRQHFGLNRTDVATVKKMLDLASGDELIPKSVDTKDLADS